MRLNLDEINVSILNDCIDFQIDRVIKNLSIVKSQSFKKANDLISQAIEKNDINPIITYCNEKQIELSRLPFVEINEEVHICCDYMKYSIFLNYAYDLILFFHFKLSSYLTIEKIEENIRAWISMIQLVPRETQSRIALYLLSLFFQPQNQINSKFQKFILTSLHNFIEQSEYFNEYIPLMNEQSIKQNYLQKQDMKRILFQSSIDSQSSDIYVFKYQDMSQSIYQTLINDLNSKEGSLAPNSFRGSFLEYLSVINIFVLLRISEGCSFENIQRPKNNFLELTTDKITSEFLKLYFSIPDQSWKGLLINNLAYFAEIPFSFADIYSSNSDFIDNSEEFETNINEFMSFLIKKCLVCFNLILRLNKLYLDESMDDRKLTDELFLFCQQITFLRFSLIKLSKWDPNEILEPWNQEKIKSFIEDINLYYIDFLLMLIPCSLWIKVIHSILSHWKISQNIIYYSEVMIIHEYLLFQHLDSTLILSDHTLSSMYLTITSMYHASFSMESSNEEINQSFYQILPTLVVHSELIRTNSLIAKDISFTHIYENNTFPTSHEINTIIFQITLNFFDEFKHITQSQLENILNIWILYLKKVTSDEIVSNTSGIPNHIITQIKSYLKDNINISFKQLNDVLVLIGSLLCESSFLLIIAAFVLEYQDYNSNVSLNIFQLLKILSTFSIPINLQFIEPSLSLSINFTERINHLFEILNSHDLKKISSEYIHPIRSLQDQRKEDFESYHYRMLWRLLMNSLLTANQELRDNSFGVLLGSLILLDLDLFYDSLKNRIKRIEKDPLTVIEENESESHRQIGRHPYNVFKLNGERNPEFEKHYREQSIRNSNFRKELFKIQLEQVEQPILMTSSFVTFDCLRNPSHPLIKVLLQELIQSILWIFHNFDKIKCPLDLSTNLYNETFSEDALPSENTSKFSIMCIFVSFIYQRSSLFPLNEVQSNLLVGLIRPLYLKIEEIFSVCDLQSDQISITFLYVLNLSIIGWLESLNKTLNKSSHSQYQTNCLFISNMNLKLDEIVNQHNFAVEDTVLFSLMGKIISGVLPSNERNKHQLSLLSQSPRDILPFPLNRIVGFYQYLKS